MEIRRLGPDDAPAYRALRMRALWEFPEAFTSSWQEDETQPMEVWELRLAGEHSLFWGAFDDGQLCGMVGLERERRAKNRHKATVVGMYVSQEYFGTGMGRALFDELLAGARAMGLQLLVLTVTEGNTVATNFYEAAGFRSFGIEPKAIRLEDRYYGKNHMYLDLTQEAP
ncbi:GNAT family N-acetyltransferase [Ramlibacter sp. PS4R-6]|uniref:GNAT family N-acetyltransferase n=1 Tax=Ramlibacter sp. PS4R-6 TaxID=3133438 RepID=UPI0030AB2A28